MNRVYVLAADGHVVNVSVNEHCVSKMKKFVLKDKQLLHECQTSVCAPCFPAVVLNNAATRTQLIKVGCGSDQ